MFYFFGPFLRLVGGASNVFVGLLNRDGSFFDYVAEFFRDSVPIDDVHAEGQVRLFKGFSQAPYRFEGQYAFSDDGKVQVRISLCVPLDA